MENKDTIFLAKLRKVIELLDEIDEMAHNNPDEQQAIDYEISDYQHLLQNEDLSDEKTLEVAKKLKNARLRRVHLNNTYELVKTYYGNNKVLIYSDNRYKLVEAITDKLRTLNQEYKYRVLDEDTVNSFKEAIIVESKVRKQRSGKYEITKEELEEKIANGMKNKDIAEELGCDQSYISVLKKKYGLGMREYTRKGE